MYEYFGLDDLSPIPISWRRNEGPTQGIYQNKTSPLIQVYTQKGIRELTKEAVRRSNAWQATLHRMKFVAAHEGGHYARDMSNHEAHMAARNDNRRLTFKNKTTKRGTFLEEVISEMSAIIFSERFDKVSREATVWASQYHAFPTARAILREKNHGVIREIVEMPYEEAASYVESRRVV